ncbi:MAG: Ig-like domain-containing protein, partial [Verrucomicrobiota bacterium]
QVEALDPEGGPLTFSARGLPANLSIDPETGLISGQLFAAGEFEVTVTATNESRATGGLSFRWTITGEGTEIYGVEPETVALYHFDENFEDASPHAYHLRSTGNVALTNANLGWMQNPFGRVARFSAVGDTLSVPLPDSLIMPPDGAPLTIEARIFPRAYLGYSIGNLPIVTIEQDFDSSLGLEDRKWATNPKGPRIEANNIEVLSPADVQALAPPGQWHLLQISFDGEDRVRCWINGELVSTTTSSPNLGRIQDWLLTLGNFDGDIDEVLIRQSPEPDDPGPPPIDTVRPTVTLTTASTAVQGAFAVSTRFSEAVSEVDPADLEVTNGLVSSIRADEESTTFTLTITPLEEGLITLRLPQNEATDAAGNGNVASNRLEVRFSRPEGTEEAVGPETLALYHFNENFKDASGNGLDLGVTGEVERSSENLTWMQNPAGQVARFREVGDTLTVSIPDALVMPASGQPLTIEARIFPRNYLGYSVANLPILTLEQHWDSSFGLEQHKWARDPKGPFLDANDFDLVSREQWEALVSLNTWHHLEILYDGNDRIDCRINGNLVQTIAGHPNVSRSTDWKLTMGNFDGDLDEVVITRGPGTTVDPDPVYPPTWEDWVAAEGFGDNPQEDSDNDGASNLLEYALGSNPDSGLQGSSGLRIILNEPEDHLEAVYTRPIGPQDLTYLLETSNDFEEWSAISELELTISESDSLETVRFPDLEGTGQSHRGFVRLRVVLNGSDQNAVTAACVWFRTPISKGYQTFGNSPAGYPVLSGRLAEASGNRLQTEEINLEEAITNALPAYIEFLDGPHEGHRFDLEGATAAGQLLIDPQSPNNTLTGLPDRLNGARFIVRPHDKIEELFPPDRFAGSTSIDLADQLHFFTDGAYQSHFLIDGGGLHQWVRTSDSFLNDSGATVLAPGAGLFFQRPSEDSGDLVTHGQVRRNRFAQPLAQGYNLIAEGYPFAASPQTRALLPGNGFLAGNDPIQTDQLQVWTNDNR